MVSVELKDAFISLLRLGIGQSSNSLLSDIDWRSLKALADKHGLSAIILDALNADGTNLTDAMPMQMKLSWIGEVLQNYEQRYVAYEKAIGSLAGFYNQHGLKMMVLKGYACGLDWPKPEHRPCGDIDIWQFGQQKEADKALTKDKGIQIDNSHHHHTVFYWRKFMVENHYDFINVYHHKSNIGLESIFKDLGQDDSHFVEVSGEKVYLPSPNLHALFLLKHNMSHFAAEGMNFRQLLDWAFFVKAHGKDVDWNWLERTLEKYGMKLAFDVFNAICVEDLGFDADLFPQATISHALKERVLNEIFEREFNDKLPENVFKRICFKLIRWKANAWKHKLCYKDSMWSAFWSGVWSHLLKPSSI